jgi:CDP-glycerol glycerophosphotransferase (TagB/SpsB family)
VDTRGGYEDTFLSTDILISDISSLLWEFLATGKPIIYTHRMDHFNRLGRKISESFYWVRNESELKERLDGLLEGDDPLQSTRLQIAREIAFKPVGGSGNLIKEHLKRDFFEPDSRKSLPDTGQHQK